MPSHPIPYSALRTPLNATTASQTLHPHNLQAFRHNTTNTPTNRSRNTKTSQLLSSLGPGRKRPSNPLHASLKTSPHQWVQLLNRDRSPCTKIPSRFEQAVCRRTSWRRRRDSVFPWLLATTKMLTEWTRRRYLRRKRRSKQYLRWRWDD